MAKTAAEWHEEARRLDAMTAQWTKHVAHISDWLESAERELQRLDREYGNAWEAWNAALIAEREERDA